MKQGTKHSEETKELIRQKRYAYYASNGPPISTMKGKTHSPETREKMRQSNIINKNHLNFGNTAGENNPSWRGGIEHVRLTRIQYKENFPWREKYYGSKRRALLLNIPHTISSIDFSNWYNDTQKICVYCDRDVMKKTERMMNLSIDRKENDLGYTLENICIACNRCNTVKGNVFTYVQMREIAEKFLKGK